jgi:hypothetical protein
MLECSPDSTLRLFVTIGSFKIGDSVADNRNILLPIIAVPDHDVAQCVNDEAAVRTPLATDAQLWSDVPRKATAVAVRRSRRSAGQHGNAGNRLVVEQVRRANTALGLLISDRLAQDPHAHQKPVIPSTVVIAGFLGIATTVRPMAYELAFVDAHVERLGIPILECAAASAEDLVDQRRFGTRLDLIEVPAPDGEVQQ